MASNLGTRLRRIRKIRGLGVVQLANLCNMHASIITRLEHQECKNMALIHLKRLAKGLDVTIDELVIGPLQVDRKEGGAL